MKRFDQGFSLVEILVAVGLAGGLAVVMMNMMQQQSKNQVTAEVKFENLEFRRQIANVLAVKKSCERTFQSLKIGDSVVAIQNAAGVPVVEIDKVYGTWKYHSNEVSSFGLCHECSFANHVLYYK